MKTISIDEIRALDGNLGELKKKVSEGDSSAQLEMALYQLYVKQDANSCLSYLEKASASGDAMSFLLLGYLHEHAIGTSKNYAEAVNNYVKGYDLLNNTVAKEKKDKDGALKEMNLQYDKQVSLISKLITSKRFCTYQDNHFLFPWTAETRKTVKKDLPVLSKNIARFGQLYHTAITDLNDTSSGLWTYRYQDCLLMPLEVMKTLAARDYLEQYFGDNGFLYIPADPYLNNALGRCLIDDEDVHDNDLIISGLLQMAGHDNDPLWQYRVGLWYEFCDNNLEPKTAAFWYEKAKKELPAAKAAVERVQSSLHYRILINPKEGTAKDCQTLTTRSSKNPQNSIGWIIESALRGNESAIQRLEHNMFSPKGQKGIFDSTFSADDILPFYALLKAEASADKKAIQQCEEMVKAENEAYRKHIAEEKRRKAELERRKAELERRRLEAERKAKEEAIRKAKEAEEAKRRAEEAKRRAEEEAKRRAEEVKRRAEAEAIRKAKEAEEAKRRAEEEAKRRAEETKRRAEEEAIRKAKEAEEARHRAKEAERKAKEEAIRKAKEAEEAKRRAEEEARKKAEEARDGWEKGVLYYGQNKYKEAIKCFLIAAEYGHADAQFHLGVCYHNGNGVGRNYKEAIKWFRKAAEQGHVDAQFQLGLCYSEGNGVDRDYGEAAKWFRKAAEQGHTDAQFQIGACYRDGDGVDRDYKEAIRWFRKAADQGHARAQNAIGKRYLLGQGVPTDPTEAFKWFHKAAEQNLAYAQGNLGDCYKDGRGVEKNNKEAIKWYRKAAEQDLAWAQSNLEDLEQLSFGMKCFWFISLLPCILAWGSSFVLGSSWSIGIFFMLFIAALIFFIQGFRVHMSEMDNSQRSIYLIQFILLLLSCVIVFFL